MGKGKRLFLKHVRNYVCNCFKMFTLNVCDVFRAPVNVCNVQIGLMCLITILVAMFGMLSPSARGSLITGKNQYTVQQ